MELYWSGSDELIGQTPRITCHNCLLLLPFSPRRLCNYRFLYHIKRYQMLPVVSVSNRIRGGALFYIWLLIHFFVRACIKLQLGEPSIVETIYDGIGVDQELVSPEGRAADDLMVVRRAHSWEL